MALIDRVREAWDDLRGTRKEEQETASIGPPIFDSPVQGSKDSTAQLVTMREVSSDYGITLSDPSEHRTNVQAPLAVPDSQTRFAPSENYEEQNLRVEHAAGKHHREFTFEKETGDIYTYKHDPTGNRIHLDSKADFYDVQEGKEPVLTTRADVLKAYQEPSPEVAATLSPEHREVWTPLEKEIGFTGADAFTHLSTRGDMQVYSTPVENYHMQIGLDSKGQFYDVDNNHPALPVSRDYALSWANVEPSFYTPAERGLREAVGNENTPDLVPYSKSGDVQSYEYTPTGGSLHLDADGKFYNADRQIVSRDEALSTMQVAVEGGQQHIAPAPAHSSGGSPEYVSSPQAAVSEMPLSQGPVQPAVQEQSISI